MNYTVHRGTKTPIVFLHGWGGDASNFLPCAQHLQKCGHTTICIDLWGFGDSPLPPEHYGIFDYAQDVANLLDKIGYLEYYIVGHSFGGRIAILLCGDKSLAKNFVIGKVVLVDSAGIKPRRGVKYRCKVALYKLKKKWGWDISKDGSSDYQALPISFRPVFVRVVNTHLNQYVPNIQASTLLVWGGKDRDTPLWMAKYLQKKIKDSGLVVFEDAGHWSFVHKPLAFALILQNFFESVDTEKCHA
ncbi:MAG: alpha/beta hydrolase [Firmicutes bacterium]|nr:alpha/beta hydrolase [Bacillota bacterium]